MNKKMYLLTTRPIDDALKDCKILRKKGVNAIASPSMGIIKNKLTLKSRYDGVFLTSRNAAHIIKILDNISIDNYEIAIVSPQLPVAAQVQSLQQLLATQEIQ